MKTIERKTWLVYVATGGRWVLQERTNDPTRLEEIMGRAAKETFGIKVKEAPAYLPDCRADKQGTIPQAGGFLGKSLEEHFFALGACFRRLRPTPTTWKTLDKIGGKLYIWLKANG